MGNGRFHDITERSGTANGDWGWGACTMDFDHDGWLDIVMVNGWTTVFGKDFSNRRMRFFRNLARDSYIEFAEVSSAVHTMDTGQGRGLACFDADGDGDQDIVIMNNSEDHIVYYRNDTVNDFSWLIVELEGITHNTFGVGARLTVTDEEGNEYIKDVGGSNNYVSHNPLEAHFGLFDAEEVDIKVVWPDLTESVVEDVAVNQVYKIRATDFVLRLTVVPGTGTGAYDEGEVIQVTAAEPQKHYFFSHWSSNGGGSFDDDRSSTTNFTMPANSVTVTAHYIPALSPDADVSVARRWIEVLLESIRNDWARPTVHARNLFHVSAAMYDAWSAFGSTGSTWLLGRTVNENECAWEDRTNDEDAETIRSYREEAMSHVAYRLIQHRFELSPRASQIRLDIEAMMGFYGLDSKNDSTDWQGDTAAAIGNHIAGCYIDFGSSDGANEAEDYINQSYSPVNEALKPTDPGNPNITDYNRWQPLSLDEFVDQAGNPSTSSEPEFLSPEWGVVYPFALSDEDRSLYSRDDFEYWVYHDPGPPPYTGGVDSRDSYQWGFSLVSAWSGQLDPTDGVMWDISPATIGNITEYPESDDYESYEHFFDRLEGGDPSTGYSRNPVTGEPYEEQRVPRGDYTRVLAEFWADGPDSETPPGHWFTILNEVNDHPDLDKRLGGLGPVLDDLEWDIKAYFALGGAMHDAAITAWGIKGWYDYLRPISAIRAMADLGQSTNPQGPNYHILGIPLVEGYIDLIGEDDALIGNNSENLNKIKVKAWRGPDFIDDPEEDAAGVGWILAENWWPYQRPTFVTPPFAGFVSGHSTYSRAAAEVLTALTGSEYFPGGMSGFEIEANEFLVFEDGPTVDMTLQWAKYYDASDQCSLSRIWGGIHPPADDIPGRLIGIDVGKDAWKLANEYFDGKIE